MEVLLAQLKEGTAKQLEMNKQLAQQLAEQQESSLRLQAQVKADQAVLIAMAKQQASAHVGHIRTHTEALKEMNQSLAQQVARLTEAVQVKKTAEDDLRARMAVRKAMRKLTAGEDVLVFLAAFEQVAVRERLPAEQWADVLGPFLTSNLQRIYCNMPQQETTDYPKLKAEILASLGLKPEMEEKMAAKRDKPAWCDGCLQEEMCMRGCPVARRPYHPSKNRRTLRQRELLQDLRAAVAVDDHRHQQELATTVQQREACWRCHRAAGCAPDCPLRRKPLELQVDEAPPIADMDGQQERSRLKPDIIPAYLCFLVTALGVTAGAHRLWSHRSYKATLSLRIFLALANSMAFQNDILEWARDHRVHHKFSETDADPHNARRGLFFSHIGWLFVRKHRDVIEKGKTLDFGDLLADKVVVFQRKYYMTSVAVMCFLLPTFVPWYFWGESLWNSYFLASILRYTISLNVSWLVNSVAHLYGNRPYDQTINPRENRFVSFGAIGEGFHNFHHTFPYDYSASELGLKLNPTTCFIDFMCFLGLASDCKKATRQMVLARKERTGDGSY